MTHALPQLIHFLFYFISCSFSISINFPIFLASFETRMELSGYLKVTSINQAAQTTEAEIRLRFKHAARSPPAGVGSRPTRDIEGKVAADVPQARRGSVQ